MKKCPFCAEEIQDNAIVCKHCGKDLDKKKVKNKQYRWSPLKIGCSIFFALTVLIIVISVTSESPSVETTKNTVKQVQVKKIIDIPSLLGKSFAEVKGILGEPTRLFEPTARQKEMGLYNSSAWKISDIEVQIDFNDMKEPTSYVFLNNLGVKYNISQLMIMAGLSFDDNHYTVEAVKAVNGSGIAGLHICKKGYVGEFCK